MAIEAGDVVYKFLGDTQNIDESFKRVGDGVRDIPPVPAEVPESIKLTSQQLREARGEARLLGEEFGIRLPRHVSNFVASMPGVGQALSAAFSATAVLFLIQALAQGTEKLSEWVSSTFIFTKAAKEAQEELVKENNAIVALNKIQEEAKQKLEELLGTKKSEVDVMREGIVAKKQEAEADLAALKVKITTRGWMDRTLIGIKDIAGLTLSQLIPGIEAQTQAEKDQLAIEQAKGHILITNAQAAKAGASVEALAAEQVREAKLRSALAQMENDKKVALASATTEADKYNLTQFYENKKLQLLKELGTKEMQQAASLAADIEAQQIEHAQKIQDAWVKVLLAVKNNQKTALDTISQATLQTAVAFTPLQIAMMKGEDAANSLGVTLRTDLVASLEHAKTALNDFLAAGITDPVAFKQFEQKIKDAQRALDNFGKAEDTFKLKSTGMWKEFERESKSGATAMDLVKQSGVNAFDDLTKNIGGAFDQVVMGEGNVGKALERATASSLASIASQAAVKAIFYTAEGLAALASFDGPAATNYFAAAGEMALVAGAAGVAGRALAGGGGGSGSGGGSSSGRNNFQYGSSLSNTGSQASYGRSSVGVQGFADGGLITMPTLAMMGEQNRREAVLPLEDPQAMAAVGKAIGAAGGGSNIHVHVEGLISPDNLTKVVDQINRRVNRGQLTLQASHSFRVTKRSA